MAQTLAEQTVRYLAPLKARLWEQPTALMLSPLKARCSGNLKACWWVRQTVRHSALCDIAGVHASRQRIPQ